MIIPINDEWRISKELYGWSAEKFFMRKNKKTKELTPEWRFQFFHPTLALSLRALADRAVGDLDDAATVSDAIEACRDVGGAVDAWLDEQKT